MSVSLANANPIPIPFEVEFPEAGQNLIAICEERRKLKSEGERLVPMCLDNPKETFITKVFKIIRGVMPIKSGVANVGRNDPCSCGSGKKFKKCCIKKAKKKANEIT